MKPDARLAATGLAVTGLADTELYRLDVKCNLL